jgi:hypothetical protein
LIELEAVNTAAARVPAVIARPPRLPDELPRIGLTLLPAAEVLIDTTESAGPRSLVSQVLPSLQDTSWFMLLPGAPVAGLPPLDLNALRRTMDRFLGELADLGKNRVHSGLALEVALSLTTALVLAFELTRLQARKSLYQSGSETTLPGVAVPLTGDDP